MDFTYKDRKESPNKIWWEEEDVKRHAGKQNQIDEMEIRAASLGTRNKWHEAVKKHLDIFKPILNYEKTNWEEILNCARNVQ